MEKTYLFTVKIMGTAHNFTLTATTYNWQLIDRYTPAGLIEEEEEPVFSGNYQSWGSFAPYLGDFNSRYGIMREELKKKCYKILTSDKELMRAVKSDWEAIEAIARKFGKASSQKETV